MDRALRRGEDVLTALVFERLRYLPVDVMWRLLVGAATPLRGERPAQPDVLSFTFWPRLQHPTDEREVVPDVVVETHDIVLVVEVKWQDVQTPEQLDREAAAVAAVHPSRSLALLALGGATGRRREDSHALDAACLTSWRLR